MQGIKIGDAIVASFGFLRVGWNRAWGIMLLLVWLVATIQAVQLARPDLGFVSFLGELATIVVATAATGALYRIGVGQEHAGDPAFELGPAGLNWGRLEWRVLGATLLVLLIVVVSVIVAIMIWAFAFGMTAAAQGGDAKELEAAAAGGQQLAALLHLMAGPAGVVSVLVAIPLIVGLVFLGAKLALFAITAADTGGFNFGRAWSLTKGALAPLIVAAIVIFVVQTVLEAIAGALGAALGGVAGQAKVWGGVAGAAVGAALSTPLFAGLQIFVYRAKRGGEGVAQTFS